MSADIAKLDPQRVEEIFRDCLFEDGEDTSSHIPAEGITTTVGFHPERLHSHKEEIKALLNLLPDVFRVSGGGGASFLQANMDRNGEQWTGVHQRMEQLFQLGLATCQVTLLTPRETWHLFPGGVPYYAIKD
jgi:hypothetical protein